MPMRNFHAVLAAIFLGLMLAACSTSTESEAADLRVNPLDPDNGESPVTEPSIRIANALQEAKQSYDDGHYVVAMRWAETAERLIIEYEYPVEDLAIAINIQAYVLLQINRIEDYFVKDHGKLEGALTKFKKVLALLERDFRARLGISLASFRLHTDMVMKADSLGQGTISLHSVREDVRKAALAPTEAEGAELLREAARKFRTFTTNRDKLLALHYVFKDVSRSKMFNEDREKNAPWLGKLSEGEESLKLLDVGASLDSGLRANRMDKDIAIGIDKDLLAVTDSWDQVRKYWRMEALSRLQVARDGFLALTKERPDYFWAQRDLVFVYQSFGAFFLDTAMEQTKLQAIKAGTKWENVDGEARRIFVSDAFQSWEKEESKRNYRDALAYTKSFVRRHQEFEKLRITRKDETDFNDENSNPFLVDLVARYRATMEELIIEERNMRASMILEAAVLCIEPLFQNRDTQLAVRFAEDLKSLRPNDPVHHLIKATAYYNDSRWEDAKFSYEAFLKDSSITEDLGRRNLARQRISQCEMWLRRTAGAGESTGR